MIHHSIGRLAAWLGAAASVVVLCLDAAAAQREAGPTAITVWATGDGVRVNPETGRYLEDRRDIHADYPSGDYCRRNAVWDAARRRVTLHAARNEFVAFQVIVESRRPVTGIEVRLSPLQGPGGRVISGRNTALYRAWYLRVTQPSSGYEKSSLRPAWYPDALLKARHGNSISFNIPDKANGIGPSQGSRMGGRGGGTSACSSGFNGQDRLGIWRL